METTALNKFHSFHLEGKDGTHAMGPNVKFL